MAAPLPRKRVLFDRNIGGVLDAGPPTSIQPHEAWRVLNVRLNANGSVRKRLGTHRRYPAIVASGTVVGISQYRRFSGGDDTIAVVGSGTVSGTQIVRLNTSTTSVTSLQPSAGVVFSEPTFAVNADRIIIGFNTATQEILVWDGSATAFTGLNSASAPIGASVNDYKNHLIVLDVFARPGSLEFSHLGSPSSFRNSDRIDLDRPTVGGTPLFGDFMAFTKDRIVRLSGDDRDNFSQETVRDSIGANTPRAIVNVENENLVVWHGRDGHFYEFNGTDPFRISSKIENWINGTSNFFNLNKTQAALESVRGINYIDGERVGFLLRESNATQNFFVAWYWYKLRTQDVKSGKAVGAWTLDQYDRAFASLGTVIENGTEKILAGDHDGNIWQLESTQADSSTSATVSDGSSILFRYRTGPIQGETVEQTKRWRELLPVVTQSGTISYQVNFYTNFSNTVAASASVTVSGGSVLPKQTRIQVGLRGEALDFEFLESGTTAPIEFQKFPLHYQELPGLRRY